MSLGGRTRRVRRARIFEGTPLGLIGSIDHGTRKAWNESVEAPFQAGQYGPAELGPSQEASGFIFFDVPAGALPVPSDATLQVRDVSTGETRALRLGDTSPCTDH